MQGTAAIMEKLQVSRDDIRGPTSSLSYRSSTEEVARGGGISCERGGGKLDANA